MYIIVESVVILAEFSSVLKMREKSLKFKRSLLLSMMTMTGISVSLGETSSFVDVNSKSFPAKYYRNWSIKCVHMILICH